MRYRRPDPWYIESEDGKVRISKSLGPPGVRYSRWQRIGPTWQLVGVYESAEEAKREPSTDGR